MKAHRTDGLSLTFGLIFLTLVAWWLVAQVVEVSLPNAGWLVAAALIVLGLLGLVGAVRGNNRIRQGEPAQADQHAQAPAAAEPTEPSTTDVDTTRTQ